MSTPFDPPADDANSADWASSETETVTEAAAHAGSRTVTEPAMATESTGGGDWERPSAGPPLSPPQADTPVSPASPPPAPAPGSLSVARSSGSHGKTVALA